MMTITEKAAYIKGLVDGIELDESKNETKIIKALVDIIDDLALSVADAQDDIAAVNDELDEMQEHIDAVDADLADLEEIIYDEWDFCDGCEDNDGECTSCFDDEDDEEEEYEYEVECPECGQSFTFGDEAFESDEPLTCPHCGTVIDEIEIEDDEDDD